MSITFSLVITRPSNDNYTMSYDIWAKRNKAPLAVGDGEFVGNFPITAGETSITVPYTATLDGAYYFLFLPRRNDQIGRETLA